jgi:hypothetical protein
MNDRIRELRAELAALEARRVELQFELAAALAAAGRARAWRRERSLSPAG